MRNLNPQRITGASSLVQTGLLFMSFFIPLVLLAFVIYISGLSTGWALLFGIVPMGILCGIIVVQKDTIQSRNRFIEDLFEAVSQPLYIIDVETFRVLRANSHIQDSDLRGEKTCHQLTHKSDIPCSQIGHFCPVEEVKTSKAPVNAEHIHYYNGVPCIIRIYAYPLLDARGEVKQMIEYCVDITEKEQVIKSLAEANRDKSLLLQEIHHRVKNNLQIMASLLSLQDQDLKKKTTHQILLECQNKINVMALLHEQLYGRENIEDVELHTYLTEVIRHLHFTLSGEHNRKQIHIQSDIMEMAADIDVAIPLGLIVCELITNSFLHGFSEAEEGVIEVRLKKEAGSRILSVRDNGKGLPKHFNITEQTSCGIRIVFVLAEQLNGAFEIANNTDAGITATVAFRFHNEVKLPSSNTP